MTTITQVDREAASRFIAESDGDYPELCGLFASHRAAGFAAGAAEKYKTFTDGMEAAAQICASLAETTYDDADAFEAATGCEAAIMRVVKEQRREQSAIAAKEPKP